jgi:3-oxoacyl-[acyl-carrier protein] reductase
MDLGLGGKSALVTGASAGLGFACAQALYNEGAEVAICSRDKGRIEKAAKQIGTDAKRIVPFVADVSKVEEITRLLTEVKEHFKGMDILITNAGGPPLGTHETLDEGDWENGYNLTFMSAVRLIQGVVPDMKRSHFGRIILLTSLAAKQPLDNLLLSNSFRAGLLGYAKTVSKELAPHGITLNSILPGFVNTERLNYFADEITEKTGRSREDVFADWMQAVPMGRLGRPEELGTLAAFLASEQASYLTGAVIAMDGGRGQGIL